MQNNEQNNTYTIVIRENIWDEESKTEHIKYIDVPTTKEAFDEYYRPINAYRRREQEHGKCCCPEKKRLLCNMDCWTCPYHLSGGSLSLNSPIKTETWEIDDEEYIDELEDRAQPLVESILTDKELLDTLYQKLSELDPTARKICELVMQGETERSSAAILGMAPRTVGYRRNKAFDFLRRELKKYL